MKLSIVVLTGIAKGKVININDDQFLIGRDPGCILRPASKSVGRRHCALLRRENRVFLRDFGSINGTLVNDQQIRATELELHDGDRLQVGPLLFAVRLEPLIPSDDNMDAAAMPESNMLPADPHSAAPHENTLPGISLGTLTDKEKPK